MKESITKGNTHEKTEDLQPIDGGGNYTSVPTILLKGKRLEEANFHIGEYVSVEINGDKILLTKTTPPEGKATKESIEEKIRGLSKNQLKELNSYLDGIKNKK